MREAFEPICDVPASGIYAEAGSQAICAAFTEPGPCFGVPVVGLRRVKAYDPDVMDIKCMVVIVDNSSALESSRVVAPTIAGAARLRPAAISGRVADESNVFERLPLMRTPS